MLNSTQNIESAIIIGGGLGGLFSGAILAKNGIKVTIIEKNSSIGGGLQSFVRFGEIFDTGMHIVGGMQEGGNIRKLCDYLGIYASDMFSKVDKNCAEEIYVASDSMTYRIESGKEGFLNSLSRYFPHQTANLRRYVDSMYAMVDKLPLYNLRSVRDDAGEYGEDFFLSADCFIEKYISDIKLQGVISHLALLYAGESRTTPAYIHAIISVLYLSGSFRFVGGTHRFADLLASSITENGGTIIVNDAVKFIHNKGRTIHAVETCKGRNISGDYYISDIHPAVLLGMFDDVTAFPKAYRERLSKAENSYSAFIINLKFHRDTFRYINHTGYYLKDYTSAWKMGEKNPSWPLGFLYMTPPEKMQGKYSTKMSVVVPMSWKYVQEWEDTTLSHRTKEYQYWKNQCLDIVLDKLNEIFPGIKNCIESVNTASPLTIRDYYGSAEGAMCGYKRDCKNVFLSQMATKTKIDNLLLTGQNVSLHGFCGVPLTAIRTCEDILGANSIIDSLKG